MLAAASPRVATLIELIERTDILAPMIAAHVPPKATNRPLTQRDIALGLHAALGTARETENYQLALDLARALIMHHVDGSDIDDAGRYADERIELARRAHQADAQVEALISRERLAYAMGEIPAARSYLEHAKTIISADHPLYGYIVLHSAAHLCYEGLYKEAAIAFSEARALFDAQNPSRESLNIAWYQHVYASEYLLDQGNYHEASNQLETAMPTLREKATPQVVIENLLALTETAVSTNNYSRAAILIQQVDSLIAEGKRYWFRPKSNLLKARLAFSQGDFKGANHQLYIGLSMVGDKGDIRMLAPLYTGLADVLEKDRTKLDNARDALERAITIGRLRGRKLYLAQALNHLGMHNKRFNMRPTERARGSGYMLEADRMFRDMGLNVPGSTPHP